MKIRVLFRPIENEDLIKTLIFSKINYQICFDYAGMYQERFCTTDSNSLVPLCKNDEISSLTLGLYSH